MIDGERAALREQQLSVAQVREVVRAAVEVQSIQANALQLQNCIVPYYMFLSSPVLHTCW